MRLSIRVKLVLMINFLVILLVILVKLFTSVFIGQIFIDKYEVMEVELYSHFQEEFQKPVDMGEILKSHNVELKGFVSIVAPDLTIRESDTPGVKRGSKVQLQFSESVRKVIDDPSTDYQVFVLDALHGEGDTLLLVGRLSENDYLILDKPLNYVTEVVDIIDDAMLKLLILMLVLGMVISYLASFVFTRPIIKIRKALMGIAEKDFSYKLDIKNNDELGDLGYLINDISKQIRDNFDEIEAQNELLDKDKTILEEMNKQLVDLSETDPLTKLYNRLKIDSVLDEEVKRVDLTDSSFSVIILDIDHFKSVNDNFGHLTGDKILIDIASILMNNSRRDDVIGRWGGEEFIIVLRGAKLQDAFNKAERFRKSIEENEFDEAKTITASFGVGEYRKDMQLNGFIKSVDDALYTAKENGRNRVEIAIKN